jgi:hypothetical protein
MALDVSVRRPEQVHAAMQIGKGLNRNDSNALILWLLVFYISGSQSGVQVSLEVRKKLAGGTQNVIICVNERGSSLGTIIDLRVLFCLTASLTLCFSTFTD